MHRDPYDQKLRCDNCNAIAGVENPARCATCGAKNPNFKPTTFGLSERAVVATLTIQVVIDDPADLDKLPEKIDLGYSNEGVVTDRQVGETACPPETHPFECGACYEVPGRTRVFHVDNHGQCRCGKSEWIERQEEPFVPEEPAEAPVVDPDVNHPAHRGEPGNGKPEGDHSRRGGLPA